LLLVIGLVAGAASRLKVAAVLGVVTASAGVSWSALPMVTTTFFAGVGLAFANLTVGLAFGVVYRLLASGIRPTMCTRRSTVRVRG
jgi:hypothetical protein